MGRYFVLLGPPGAGKGTQAVAIARELDVVHVSTGDLFRYHRERGTKLGLLVKDSIDRGALVPDEVTVRMVRERLAQEDAASGVVLDGFPRTCDQGDALDRLLAEKGQQLARVVLFKVGDAETVRRIASRRICSKCQRSYHLINSPPQHAGICDVCGGTLIQRADDQPETIRRRLHIYWSETAPLVDYYRKRSLLAEIDGEKPVAEVQRDLLAALTSAQS